MNSSGARFFPRLASTLVLTALSWSAIVPNSAVLAQSRRSEATKRKHAPLALARLAQVKAIATDKGVLIEWRTGFEVDNLGFNIYRERNGIRERINPGIIAGSALIAGQGTVLDAGYSYSWFDAAGTPDCRYFLSDIDISGKSTLHPVVTPEWKSSLPAYQQAQLLSALGARSGAIVQHEWAGSEGEKSGSISPESPGTTSIADQWPIANQPALKIGVRSNGWYRITQPEMAAAGFDTNADAGKLRMFVNAVEIAIRVSRNNGAMTASDYLEFWGQGIDTPSTDTQIYWLVNGTQSGRRIASATELHAEASPIFPSSEPTTQILNSNSAFGWSMGTGNAQVQPTNSDNSIVKTPSANNTITDDLARRPLVTESLDALEVDRHVTANSPLTAVSKSGEASRPRRAGPSTAGFSNTSRPKLRSGSKKSTRRGFHRSRSRRNRQNHPKVSRVCRNHPLSLATAPAFVYNVVRKDRTVYYSSALNGAADNFFGEVLFGDPDPLTLRIHDIETTAAGPAQLQVGIQGISPQQHQVNVSVNSVLVGTITLANQDNAVNTFLVPLSLLLEGGNLVKLQPVAAGHDSDIVDFIRLTYPHSFRAENNSLQFSVKSTQTARIEGFTSVNIRVFDITDATAVQEVRPIVEPSGAGFAATVPGIGRGKARRLVALPDTSLSHPASLMLNQPSTLNDNSNAADLLIISYKDFIPALAPLVAQRHDRDGLTVKVVDVEDVYDEFSYGNHTSQAIEDFLSLAKQTWTKAPGYLLLVGDASYDPRNYLGRGFFDFVPSKHVDTLYMEADSDDSLADFDNDGVPEISVGRLPARTLAEADLMIGKIVNFAPANVPQSALMVADNPVGYDFEFFNEQLINLLPTDLKNNVQRVYRQQEPSDTAANNDIVNKINAGVALVNYSGHGNVDIWGGTIFSSNDTMVNGELRRGARSLTNGNRLPFVVVMDCLNGFFSDPAVEGLAESLMKAPNGGAVASFASSGLTVADPQHQMGQRMFQILFSGSSIPIGDASRQSKTATSDLDVRRTWILFGDPTMKIR